MKPDAKKFYDPSTFSGAVAVGVAVSLIVVIVIAVALAASEPLRDAAREEVSFRAPVWALILAGGVAAVGLYADRRGLLRGRAKPGPPPAVRPRAGTDRIRHRGVDWEGHRHPQGVEGPFCPKDGTPLWESTAGEPRSPHESDISRTNPWYYSEGLRFECIACEKHYNLRGGGSMKRILNEVATLSQRRERPASAASEG